MFKKVATFKGKKLTDMSKEELIEALNISWSIIENERDCRKRQRKFLADINKPT